MLVVDPSAKRLEKLRRRLSEVGNVVTCSEFRLARERLFADRPEFLVSHIKLGAFNALHLVHLAVGDHLPTRCILFDEPTDAALVAEAKSLGAFYETTSRLPFALPSYLLASLPHRDRRVRVVSSERRTRFRGGRRSSDVAPEILGADS